MSAYDPSDYATALATTTRENYFKKGVIQNGVSSVIPTLALLKNKGGFKEETMGGEKIRVNFRSGKNTTETSYTGYDALNITPQEGFKPGFYDWAHHSWSVSIDGPSKFKNMGDARIVDMVREKEIQVMEDAAEDINALLWKVDITSAATGNDGKDILSIPSLITKTPSGAVAVAGLDRSATANAFIRNKATNGSGYTSALKLAKGMKLMMNQCNTAKGAKVEQVCADMVSYQIYEDHMDEKVRYAASDVATVGFERIKVKQAEMYWDPYVPDAQTPGNGGPDTTLTKGTMYFFGPKSIKWCVGKDHNFAPTPFERMGPQDAKTSLTLLYAQLLGCSLRSTGVIYNIDPSIV